MGLVEGITAILCVLSCYHYTKVYKGYLVLCLCRWGFAMIVDSGLLK